MQRHDFFEMMASVKEALAGDYKRIRKRSRDDPGTAGDQAEEDWASVLRNWLPAIYPIVTKGRILFPDGSSSPQIDILVLAPSYPIKLRNEKYLFSGGVVAAFECKSTLRASHIDKFFETSSYIKRKIKNRFGTPFKELNSAPIVGLLAHSHSLKAERPNWKIHELIESSQTKYAQHPRELPDIFCVADCVTLPLGKYLLLGKGLSEEEKHELRDMEASALIQTMYVIHDEDAPLPETHKTGAILAGLVHELTYRMAFEDSSIRDWADHLSELGFYGGIGRPVYWTADDLSSEVRKVLTQRGHDDDRWSEWCKHLP